MPASRELIAQTTAWLVEGGGAELELRASTLLREGGAEYSFLDSADPQQSPVVALVGHDPQKRQNVLHLQHVVVLVRLYYKVGVRADDWR